MTQRQKSAHSRLQDSSQRDVNQRRLISTLPAQSLCLLSSVSLLGNGLVFAQTETSIDNIVPTIESSQSTAGTNYIKKDIVVPEASQTQPAFSQRRAKLRQRLRSREVAESQAPVSQSKPKIEASESAAGSRKRNLQVETSRVAPVRVREEKPKLEVATPTRSIPNKLPEVSQPSNNAGSTASTTVGKTKDYNNAYIDPNDYNSNTTDRYLAPNSVVVTERSSGCKTILSSGQGISGNACANRFLTPSRNQRVANGENQPAPNWLRRSQTAQLATVPPVRRVVTAENSSNSNNSWRSPRISSRISSGGVVKNAYRPNRFIPNPSEFTPLATTRVSATAIAPSGGTLPPVLADGNVAPRVSTVAYDFPLDSVLPQIPYTGTVAYRGGSGMMFPLSVPAPITSLFGWRTHPITGDRRFHAGTDLGAPTGTPILAAARGQVESADWRGGYGLAVTINHSSAQQTLYAHMSQIFVQPGQWVEAGTVIGQVGSTGNSTGPHLHFEIRHLTQNGWVAVDPGVELQTALSQLLQNSRTAQVIRDPGS